LASSPQKRAGVFFPFTTFSYGPRGKQEDDFFLFLIPCLVCLPSAIILCRERRGKDGTKSPQEESFYCLLRWHFSFLDTRGTDTLWLSSNKYKTIERKGRIRRGRDRRRKDESNQRDWTRRVERVRFKTAVSQAYRRREWRAGRRGGSGRTGSALTRRYRNSYYI